MSEDAPVTPLAPATAGDSPAAIAASAARIRELERRAFARPDSPEAESAAAAAAVELAELRARTPAPARAAATSATATRAPSPWSTSPAAAHEDSQDDDVDFDPELDDPTLGERLAAAGAALIARLRALPPRTVRIIGVSALATGFLAAAGITAYSIVNAPPPAYAIFAADEKPAGERVNLVTGDSIAWTTELEQRGTIVLEGPHLFGERDDPVRVGVYREWLDADRTEVCAALVMSNAWSFRTVCTSEADFRREGVSGIFDQEGMRIDFAWMPDGEVSLDSEQSGVTTFDELRALDLPAVAAIDAAGLDLDTAREVLPYYPDVLAGPLELGQADRWRFFAVIVQMEGAPWDTATRPHLCLTARDDRTRADGSGIVVGCAPAERFIEEGLSVQTDDGLTAQWDADNVFDAELP